MTPDLAGLRAALAGPLAAMAAYPRFILYRVEPDPKRPGKTNKFPLHPVTRAVCGAASPEAHMTADAALAAARPGEGVGFYFDPGDGFWFLDVDGAYRDGAWSPLVAELDALLPGAAREVSHSGTGLHYFGRGPVPPHRCRDVRGDGLEFYTGRRFVALTGAHASGDASAEPVAGVAALVERWFPPGEGSAVDWTEDGPRPEWRGPTDDDDLLRRAMRSQSAAGIFQGKLTFAQLWEGEDGGKASEADMALAAHLAFWTGCDMPRMERLMLRSGLVRDKWEREDYLRGTIMKVCEPGRAVCQDAEPTAPAVAEQAQPPAPAAPDAPPRPARGSLLGGPGMAALFHGCVYVRDDHQVLTPWGGALGPGQFTAAYGGYKFLMTEGTEGAGAIKSEAFLALTQSSRYVCAQVDRTVFDPRLPFGAVAQRGGRSVVNVYRPLPGARAAGDPSPFLQHLERMLPDERDRRILLSWMAAAVQHPGVKFQWWPVVQGWEGNGKSLLAEILAHCVGRPYTARARVSDLANNFNGWMARALLVIIDDIGSKALTGETLDLVKPMVTASEHVIERKGHDSSVEPIFFNGFGTTNFKDAVPVQEGTRRFAVFLSAQQSAADLERDGMTGAYLHGYWRWLNDQGGFEVVHDFLATYAIADEFNPAGDCVRAPATSGTAEAIRASRTAEADRLDDVIDSGQPGFRGGWVNATTLRVHLGRDCPTVPELTDALAARGYVPHPALANNRGLTRDPLSDGKKGRLFVLRDHETITWTSGSGVAKAYETAQVAPIGFGKSDHVAAVS